MRKLNLFLLSCMILATCMVASCNEHDISLEADNPSLAAKSIGYSDAMEILYLGTMGLTSHPQIKALVNTEVLDDDMVTFADLKAAATGAGLNLESLMTASLLSNGGSVSQAARLSGLLSGYADQGVSYETRIRILFADDVNLQAPASVIAGDVAEPTGAWMGKTAAGSAIQITESFAINNPVWTVEIFSPEARAAGWGPWRRCWCDCRPIQDPYEPGTVLPNHGACSLTKGSVDDVHLRARCGRSNFGGKCDGDICICK